MHTHLWQTDLQRKRARQWPGLTFGLASLASLGCVFKVLQPCSLLFFEVPFNANKTSSSRRFLQTPRLNSPTAVVDLTKMSLKGCNIFVTGGIGFIGARPTKADPILDRSPDEVLR